MEKVNSMEEKILKVKLIKSLISSKGYQRSSVRGLGLFRVGQVVSVTNSPENRGMINKAKHLLEIKEQ